MKSFESRAVSGQPKVGRGHARELARVLRYAQREIRDHERSEPVSFELAGFSRRRIRGTDVRTRSENAMVPPSVLGYFPEPQRTMFGGALRHLGLLNAEN